MEKETQVSKCPNGHAIQWYCAHPAISCIPCGKLLEPGKLVWHCRSCEWNECEDCGMYHLEDPVPPEEIIYCPNKHPLKHKISHANASCNNCYKEIDDKVDIWECKICDWNSCAKCTPGAVPKASTIKNEPGQNQCPNCHDLEVTTSHNVAACDICGEVYESQEKMYTCRQCQWDKCEECALDGKVAKGFRNKCPNNHKVYTTISLSPVKCDACGKSIVRKGIWQCDKCNWHRCAACGRP